jgi:hypothetical protein
MIETEHILTEALSNALEKMAFLTVMPIEEEMGVPQNTLLSQIHFTGPRTIQILAGADFARLLAENMSAGQDTDQAACLDIFRELSNVTCGLLLPVLSGSSEDVFDVTVPTVVWGENSPTWNEFTADRSCYVLNVENNRVAVKLIYRQ